MSFGKVWEKEKILYEMVITKFIKDHVKKQRRNLIHAYAMLGVLRIYQPSNNLRREET